MRDPRNVDDYGALAARRLDLATVDWIDGGAEDEVSLRESVEAFQRLRFRPRQARGVAAVELATTIVGIPSAAPLVVSPFGMHGLFHPDGERATVAGAQAAGVPLCLPTVSTEAPQAVRAAGPEASLLFQLYVMQDEGLTQALVDRALAAGAQAVVVTLDAQFPGNREQRSLAAMYERLLDLPSSVSDLIAVRGASAITSAVEPALSWRHVERLIAAVDVPVLVKGVLRADDARIAHEIGVGGIVVSNHGGRQLDGAVAPIDALGDVVTAVGDAVEVFLDGGVRRGSDVVKALGLGARAVFVGRPAIWGLAVDGANGVADVLGILRRETATAMRQLGCATPAELREQGVVVPAAPGSVRSVPARHLHGERTADDQDPIQHATENGR